MGLGSQFLCAPRLYSNSSRSSFLVGVTSQVMFILHLLKWRFVGLYLGSLRCDPDEAGGTTLDGGDIIVTAWTSVYGIIAPSIYWYSNGEMIASSTWSNNNTITYVRHTQIFANVMLKSVGDTGQGGAHQPQLISRHPATKHNFSSKQMTSVWSRPLSRKAVKRTTKSSVRQAYTLYAFLK